MNEIELKSDVIDIIKNTIAKEATKEELALFLYQCRRTGLDPLARQIYLVPRNNRVLGIKTHTIQISIDGSRLIAERSGKYAGQVGPFWCAEDGEWKDVWLKKTNPVAAKVGVLRSDFKEALFAVANFADYNAGTTFWNKFPALMISKCSESLALRRAFPQELSGLYTTEEMPDEDEDEDEQIPQIEEKATKKLTSVTPIIEFNFTNDEHKKLLRGIIAEKKLGSVVIAEKLPKFLEFLKINKAIFEEKNIKELVNNFPWES
jgi:phage recombination protein Bet